MDNLLGVLAVVLAFAGAAASGWLMLQTGIGLAVLDQPNERSLHTRPTPRVGGIPLLLGASLGASALALAPAPALILWALAPGLIGLALLGALDDRYNLRARTRFACQIAAAGAAVLALRHDLGALAPQLVWGLAFALVLTITWSANLYNFMDGSDGLAGSMAVWGFGSLAAVAARAGAPDLCVAAAALAGGAAGFLLFNWHPARFFMGDVGSVPLGFAAAVLGIAGCGRGTWTVWTPLVAFWPFWFDASLTLSRRALRGARIWEAHREHLYQKLVRMGWGHLRTAWAETGAMILCAGVALLLARLDWKRGALVVAGLMAVSAGCTFWIEARWRKFQATTLPQNAQRP